MILDLVKAGMNHIQVLQVQSVFPPDHYSLHVSVWLSLLISFQDLIRKAPSSQSKRHRGGGRRGSRRCG